MDFILLNIPGVDPMHQSAVQIRALCVGNKSDVLPLLAEWAIKEKPDHKKIIHAMQITAQTKRGEPISENHVKKCANPLYGDVYEFRAHKGSARVMFFYETAELIVCTNVFWKKKSTDSQDAAFKRCFDVRKLWDKFKHANQHDGRITAKK